MWLNDNEKREISKYIAFNSFIIYQFYENLVDIEKEGIIMDNLIIGLIVILALAYLGTKIYKQVSGTGGCGCGEAVAPKNLLVAVVTAAVMVRTRRLVLNVPLSKLIRILNLKEGLYNGSSFQI